MILGKLNLCGFVRFVYLIKNWVKQIYITLNAEVSLNFLQVLTMTYSLGTKIKTVQKQGSHLICDLL